MMRVAIGAMKHESNTFTTLTTPLEEFDPVTGEAVYDSVWTDRDTATRGIVHTLAEAGHEVVPTRFGSTLPSGVVEADAYEYLKGGIVEGVREADDLDAVCLDLHGSMYAETEDDPEGALVQELRDVVGDETPIVTSLDMHATVTQRLVDGLDGVAAYRTAPHVDVYDSGVRAATVLNEILDGAETTVERVYIPMLLCGEQSETDAPPMEGLIQSLREADEDEDVLQSSFLLGFPWADSPHGGCYAVVTGRERASGTVRETAEELAREFWARHEEFDFTTEAYPLDKAIDEALETPDSPVVVSDSGDNPTAGATEDLTVVDRRLRERGVDDALVAVVNDPDAHADCVAAGEGGEVRLELGRTEHAEGADPLLLDATVVTVGEPQGVPAAVVESEGVRTVVTAERTSVYDPEFLRELDEDPEEYEVVFVKSGYQSPDYQDVSARSMLALTPGDTNCVLENLPYESVPRPVYPVDPEMEWEP